MKPMKWILAIGLVCGATLFTSCSDDNASSSTTRSRNADPSENHAAFVEKTREDLKTLAKNLNFTSWEFANQMNMYLNEYVLLNEEFQKSVLATFIGEILQSMAPVETGSELAEMGYEAYFAIDFSKIKKQFSMNDDMDGFEVTDADNFELIVSGFNVETKKIEKGIYKLTLEFDGEAGRHIAELPFNLEGIAAIVIIPENVKFAISMKSSEKWNTLYKGEFTNSVKLKGNSKFVDRLTSDIGIKGEVISSVSMIDEMGEVTGVDSTRLKFDIGQNAETDKGSLTFSYEHNGKKMLDLRGVMANTNGAVDLDQFTSSNNLLDVLIAMMAGNSLDEFEMTFLDELTIDMKVSDLEKMLKAQIASVEARRSYAGDEKTIKAYADEMNEVMTITLESKSTNQKMDVKFDAVKFGIDYWTMPSVKFSDEKDYISLVDLLDQQSIMYALNIVDHAVEPLSQSIIVVRQLMQYIQMLTGE